MKKLTTLLMVFSIVAAMLNAQSDNRQTHTKVDACLSETHRTTIKQQLRANRIAAEHLITNRSSMHPHFIWPVRKVGGFHDPGYYYIAQQVDHNPQSRR